ncbi:hypothetical protein T07_10887 [Trichinella nelsoni]|uniref:Uncharacterized protein n=1 Tax=Trichinella nelsoni TaxID=6336 RepID=A0A0V0RWV5_9BILA|nr:hypothetical protein T07_10887 [Trichinella nelsoni]
MDIQVDGWILRKREIEGGKDSRLPVMLLVLSSALSLQSSDRDVEQTSIIGRWQQWWPWWQC